jgi:hypothetical protein
MIASEKKKKKMMKRRIVLNRDNEFECKKDRKRGRDRHRERERTVVPLKRQPPIFRYFRFVNCPISLGILPVSIGQLLISRCFIDVSNPISLEKSKSKI